MKTLLLRVDNQGLHYNAASCLPWEATNLPVGGFRFREYEAIFWRVRMCAYQAKTQQLELEVLDYNAAYTEAFLQQIPKQPVSRILFRPLSAPAFKANLSYYDGRRLASILAPVEEKDAAPLAAINWSTPPVLPGTVIEEKAKEKAPQPATVHLHFETQIKELQFELGVIKGTHYVEEWGIVVDYQVANDFIIPEFDLVKSYLAKALKTRRVEVEVKTTLAAALDDVVDAKSPVLEAIDEKILELVRSQAVERLLHKPKFEAAVDKSLFTADEMYDQYEEDAAWGDALRSPAEKILEDILGLGKVRNAKQLQFLAGKVHAPEEKLRFTLTPLFGFIFVAYGARKHHFIWELLNSHATYIWSVDAEEVQSTQCFRELEKILNFIKAHGRQEYRRNHHLSDVFTFRAINHQSANSNFVDGFPRWRNLLLEQLV